MQKAQGPGTRLHLEFPQETSLILRFAGKAGNPVQTTQGNRLSCRDHPLEKDMAAHSSILPWEIPWIEEPGRLWSMGSLRLGHD